jgi:hypothetical protein
VVTVTVAASVAARRDRDLLDVLNHRADGVCLSRPGGRVVENANRGRNRARCLPLIDRGRNVVSPCGGVFRQLGCDELLVVFRQNPRLRRCRLTRHRYRWRQYLQRVFVAAVPEEAVRKSAASSRG